MSKSYANNLSRVGIGIDFGTTNSVAALFDGEQLILVTLEGSNTVMPSANYVEQDFSISTGQIAIDKYISDNKGRRVELSAEYLGEVRTTTGGSNDPSDQNDTTKVFGRPINDAGLPGRLFRGTKRLLGSTSSERTPIFGRNFRLVALITPILLAIREGLDRIVPNSHKACLGHPVDFEGVEKGRNQIGLSRLSEAYRHAGISEQSFCPEPVAAAISYLHHNRSEIVQRVLTLDFGGGTLDLSILRSDGSSFEVEATDGIGLGGDKIDQIIFRELICPLLGKGERWTRIVDGTEVDTLFPFSEYEDLLLNWPVAYMLTENKYTAPVALRMCQGDEAAKKFRRLYDLIHQNYSYQVFEAIKSLKAKLSVVNEAKLDIPEIDIELILKRCEFEEIISDILSQLDEVISQVMAKANIRASNIDIVMRTGGSSQIPAVKNLLERRFPNKVVEHNPFTSVAAGLAIVDHLGLNDTHFFEH